LTSAHQRIENTSLEELEKIWVKIKSNE